MAAQVTVPNGGTQPSYKLTGAEYEDVQKFIVTSNSGHMRFAVSFLHMEWTIVIIYNQVRNQLTTEAVVSFKSTGKNPVNASLKLKLVTADESEVPDEEWAGAADQSLIVHWPNFMLKPDVEKKSEAGHVMDTKPLIGTDSLLLVTIRVFNLSVPVMHSCHFNWQEIVTSLFLSADSSDITLISANGTKFPAHQFVLKSQSQYFRGHLTHDPQSEITVRAPAAAVKEMIRFMYLNEVEMKQMDEVAHDLLQLADYYCIPDLLDKCSDFLMQNLTPHNVTKVIEYAAAAGLKKLAYSAVDTFIQNVNQEEWKAQFASLHPPAQLIIRQMRAVMMDMAAELQSEKEKSKLLPQPPQQTVDMVTALTPVKHPIPGRGRNYNFKPVVF